MLSYQHGYHAGNLADVHKHAALAWVLTYLAAKDKPLSYLETHAGRGLYDLGSDEAAKTGEAVVGIDALADRFHGHPYGATVSAARAAHGPRAYPGSPWLADHILRETDVLHLAELHPAECTALEQTLPWARVHRQDGYAMAQSVCPPTPRRGLLLIDPSYEVKDEYRTLPRQLAKVVRAWPVGVVIVWYPILTDARHVAMLEALDALSAGSEPPLHHEVRFPPAREGHGMIGSGLFVLNPPWGMSEAMADIRAVFDTL